MHANIQAPDPFCIAGTTIGSRLLLGTAGYPTQRILVEGASRRDATELSGRTGNNRVVNFRGTQSLVGRFVDVTVTAALAHSLRGHVRSA